VTCPCYMCDWTDGQKNKLLIVWEIPLHPFENSGKFNIVTRRHIPKDFNHHHMQSCVFCHETSNCILFRNERGLSSRINTWIQFHKNTADTVRSSSGFGCCLCQYQIISQVKVEWIIKVQMKKLMFYFRFVV
jgi:hypothetical protein